MRKLYKRYGKIKTYIFSAILIFILLLAISGCSQYMAGLFRWEGLTFKLIEQHNQGSIFKDQHGNLLEATIESGQLNSHLLLLHLNYLDKAITYDSLDFDEGIMITLSDGTIYQDTFFSISTNGSINEGVVDSSTPTEVILVNKVLKIMQNSLSKTTLFIFYSFSLLLILVGLMNIIYPEVSWKIKYFMDVDGGEPSEYYIISAKVTGCLLIGFALLMPIFFLTSTWS